MAASTCHVKITMSGVRAAPSYVTEQLSAKSLDVAQPVPQRPCSAGTQRVMWKAFCTTEMIER